LEEEIESLKKVEDIFAVKLTSIPFHTTEQDIRSAFAKFGKIKSCYIPQSDVLYLRSNKIAIVWFKDKDSASRAAQERKINIDFAEIEIEKYYY